MDLGRFGAVLFDLDGTLIHSTPAVRAAWATWADAERVDRAALDRHAGRPARDIVAALLPQDRVADGVARYTAIAERTVDGVVPLPGAVAALRATAGHNAIVTSSSRAVVGARVAAAALPVPPVVVTVDDVRRGKPDPEAYLRGAQLLGVRPERCLAVEDSSTGVRSATEAGCTVVGLVHDGEPAFDTPWVVRDLSRVRFAGIDGGIAVRLQPEPAR